MSYAGLLACLGNPGSKYEHTRHNMGFMLLDLVLDAAQRQGQVKELNGKKFRGDLWAFSLPSIPGTWLALAPHTYMNDSGVAVQPTLAWHNLSPSQLVVAHDEMDIPCGALRFKYGGGLAGHNGLASIARQLGTKDFYRLRIGIGKPMHREDVLGWVLGRPEAMDRRKIGLSLPLARETFVIFATKGLARATEFAHHALDEVNSEMGAANP